MEMKKRSIAGCIILTLVTFGIYGIYWFVKITDDTNTLAGEQGTNGVTAFILTIVTCGIYGIYWAYTTGEKLDRVRASHGEPTGSLGVLYLVLEFFIAPVAIALMQSELNKYAQG